MATLTQQERAHYEEHGYVVPGFSLPQARVADLRGALDRVIAANPHARPEHLVSAHVGWPGAPAGNAGNEGIVGDKAFYDLVTDPDILDLVEAVIGPDILCWGAHLFCKPGGDGMETPWHQDGDYWPIRPLATCSVWLAIDDVTVENACMRFIPGSHRGCVRLEHQVETREGLVLNRQVKPGLFDEAEAVNIELAAGQMSLHDVYLVHGSTANTSPKRRAGIALRFMPATSHFDRDMFKAGNSTGLHIDFSQRPLFLLRGENRHPGNTVIDVRHAGTVPA